MIANGFTDWRQIGFKGLEFILELRATGMAELYELQAKHSMWKELRDEGGLM